MSRPEPSDIKDFISKLKHKTEELTKHMDFEKDKIELEKLEKLTLSEDFWNDRDKAQDILKRTSDIKNHIEKWSKLSTDLEDAEIMLTMAVEENDNETLDELWVDVNKLAKYIDELELQEMLSHELDHMNAMVAINAGAGGVEAMDWAEMLQRMYVRWAQRKKFKVNIIDVQPGAEAGIASCTMLIEGEYAYGYLKGETGVHRLVRISPFDSNARRHTSFASVTVSPDLDNTVEIEVREEDLRIDVYRASGAGGQHVNKTESAVRITHNPTGIVVTCQNERSQHQNKATAMRMLRSKLYQLKLEEQEQEMENIVGQKQKIDFGSQIRSYVLAPYRLISDHRTELKIGNVDAVLDGDLDEFIHAYLIKMRSQN